MSQGPANAVAASPRVSAQARSRRGRENMAVSVRLMQGDLELVDERPGRVLLVLNSHPNDGHIVGSYTHLTSG